MPDATVRRSHTRAIGFGVLSLLVAGGTAVTAWQIVERYERELNTVRRVDQAREVVLAATDLRAGQTLTAEDLRTELRVVSEPESSTFGDSALLVGEQVGDRILAGEVIRRERLMSSGARLKANEVLDPGTRAITVRASRASSVGGLLEPGFYVDVIVTIRPETNELTADWVTETILQGVRVIALNDDVVQDRVEGPAGEEGEEEARASREDWVTLEVEPSEAEQLAMAAARGQLHLTLRAEDDFELFDVGQPLVTNALVGLPMPVKTVQAKRLARKRAAVEPTPPTHVTDVIRGGELTTETFDEEGNRVEPAKGAAGRR
jgi:pilus assembly protein CpaB